MPIDITIKPITLDNAFIPDAPSFLAIIFELLNTTRIKRLTKKIEHTIEII
jgi:hypothetical protein